MAINKHLIPVKVLLFFIYGGFGCLWPFLSLHMKRLGLTIEETAIINLVTPFTSLLGPPLACLLANKSKKCKLILILSLIVCATAFSALLFVPPSVRHPQRDAAVGFECDMMGGRVHVERCENQCAIPARSPSPSSIKLRNCHYMCDERLIAEGPGIASPLKPYICVDHENGTVCSIFNVSGTALDIKLAIPLIEFEENADECTYPLIKTDTDGNEQSLVHCRIQELGCAVHCLGFPDPEDPEALRPHQCQKIEGHPLLTFGAYLLLRIVAEFFMYATLALLEATVMNNLWDFSGFYSQQFLWGLLAIGILCPIVGIIIDLFTGIVPYMDYSPAFALFSAIVLITVILLAFLPLRVHSCSNKLGSYVGRVIKSCEVITLFVMMFCLGNVFGLVETFYYWFLDDKGAGAFFIGLTLTIGIFPSLPLLFFGDRIIKICSHANILIAAFFAYSIRLMGYTLLDDYWHFLPFEMLRVLDSYLMWVAAITYCEKLGPKVLASTITGTVILMHTNVGRGIGALTGGLVMSYFGAVIAFRCFAVYVGCIGLIYMALYHFYLKTRRSPIYIETNLNGHYTPMEVYNNGESQAHKPMLLQDKDRY